MKLEPTAFDLLRLALAVVTVGVACCVAGAQRQQLLLSKEPRTRQPSRYKEFYSRMREDEVCTHQGGTWSHVSARARACLPVTRWSIFLDLIFLPPCLSFVESFAFRVLFSMSSCGACDPAWSTGTCSGTVHLSLRSLLAQLS